MDSVLGHEHSDIRIRTCIAHRHRKPDVDLLRIVAEPHPAGLDHGYIATPDPQRRKPGVADTKPGIPGPCREKARLSPRV